MSEANIDTSPSDLAAKEKIADQVAVATAWLEHELRQLGVDENSIDIRCQVFSLTALSNLLFAEGVTLKGIAEQYLERVRLDKAA
ncbi:MAG: hypothetical protein V1846_03110 [Candidatus Komeilibacteria bacterium]